MKASPKIQLEILRLVERHEYSLMPYEQFSEHEQGGFEEVTTPNWSREQAYNIRQLILHGSLLESFSNGDEPWLNEATPGSPYRESYIHMTPNGHQLLKNAGVRGWLKGQMMQVPKNLLTILVSVGITLFTAWIIDMFGWNK